MASGGEQSFSSMQMQYKVSVLQSQEGIRLTTFGEHVTHGIESIDCFVTGLQNLSDRCVIESNLLVSMIVHVTCDVHDGCDLSDEILERLCRSLVSTQVACPETAVHVVRVVQVPPM